MERWLRGLFDAEGMRATDRWAIEEAGIPEADLIEAAGTALAEAVAELAPEGPVRIVCGKGNNGADGLARRAAAEHDGLRGRDGRDLLRRAAGRLRRLARGIRRRRRRDPRHRVSRARRGSRRSVAIEAINRCGAPVVACDIASGVDASSGEVVGAAVEAVITVSFHAAKLGHVVAPGKWHAGELRVVPIGIPDGAPVDPVAGTIEPAVLELAPRRGASSTKFSSGQVAIAGASRGLTGAVRMSSLAAIRAGAGYATVAVPADLEAIFETGEPEVMSVGCPGGDGCLAPGSAKALLRVFEKAAAGVLGPGLGRDPGSVELAREVLTEIEAPLVLDADGLNAFAGDLGGDRRSPRSDGPHASRGRARAAARQRRRGGRGPPSRVARARPPAPPAPSSSSRGTTRSSPTGSGSPSTRSRPRRWRRRAPATSSPVSARRCSPAASTPSRPPARRCSPTPGPGATPPSGSGWPSR